MKKKMIIAVDGRSSCGKSTFAKAIASKLDYIYIDSGAMYRAVALFCLRENLVDDGFIDRNSIVNKLPSIEIHFSYNNKKKEYETFLNSENVELEIRSIKVTRHVSAISSIPQVRERMVELQREIGFFKGIVMDGRDIGTVVFPDADIKIFMTASVDIRAERRFNELAENGVEARLDEIKSAIEQRDHDDETRKISPLKKAEDAIVLNNSQMTVEEQMEWFMEILEKK